VGRFFETQCITILKQPQNSFKPDFAYEYQLASHHFFSISPMAIPVLNQKCIATTPKLINRRICDKNRLIKRHNDVIRKCKTTIPVRPSQITATFT